MIEAAAYDLLGWPRAGNGLALQMSGSDRDDWIVAFCDCGMRGLSTPEAFQLKCVGCEKDMRMEDIKC